MVTPCATVEISNDARRKKVVSEGLWIKMRLPTLTLELEDTEGPEDLRTLCFLLPPSTT